MNNLFFNLNLLLNIINLFYFHLTIFMHNNYFFVNITPKKVLLMIYFLHLDIFIRSYKIYSV